MSNFKISRLGIPNHSSGNLLSQVENINLGQTFENIVATNDASIGNNLTVTNDTSVGNNITAGGTITAPSVVDINNVKYYGAVGDGVADDTAAVQAALDAAGTAIYFPQGSYAVSSTLVLSVGKTIWAQRNTASITALAGTSPNPVLRITGALCRVQGIAFAGSTGAGTVAVEIAGPIAVLSDCEVFTTSETGLAVNANQALVENCWIKSTTNDILVGFNIFGNTYLNNRKTGGTPYITFNDGGNNVVINSNGGNIPITFTNACQNNTLVGNYIITADAGSTYTNINGTGIIRNTLQVVGNRGAAVAAVPTGGAATAADNAAAINALIDRLKATGGHGLIAD